MTRLWVAALAVATAALDGDLHSMLQYSNARSDQVGLLQASDDSLDFVDGAGSPEDDGALLARAVPGELAQQPAVLAAGATGELAQQPLAAWGHEAQEPRDAGAASASVASLLANETLTGAAGEPEQQPLAAWGHEALEPHDAGEASASLASEPHDAGKASASLASLLANKFPTGGAGELEQQQPLAAWGHEALEPRDAGEANASFASFIANETLNSIGLSRTHAAPKANASLASLIANETLHSIGLLRNRGVSEFVTFQVRRMQVEYEYSPQDDVNKLSLACLNCCLLGFFGLDRCFVGQVTLGFCKCATCGGFGALFLVDFMFITLNCMLMERKMGVLGFHAKFETETVMPAFNITSAWVLVLLFVGVVLKVALARRKHAVTQ